MFGLFSKLVEVKCVEVFVDVVGRVFEVVGREVVGLEVVGLDDFDDCGLES